MANNQFNKILLCAMAAAGENIVVAYIRQKHINKTKLAEKMGMSQQNLNGRLNKNDLCTDFLFQLSDAMEHDFFADLSMEFKRKKFKVEDIVSEPEVKYGGGSLDELIGKVVERKLVEILNRK